MDEQPAAEEAAELALDEAGQADPVGAGGGRGEEVTRCSRMTPCRTVSAAARGT
jgi:hypothetical protein